MNAWMWLPEIAQYAVLAFVGACVGGQVNRAIYRLAWTPRNISPWSSLPDGVAERPLWSRLPLVGWWALRGEASVHGRGFWVRPVLIEVFLAIAYPFLYDWITGGGLLSVAGKRLGADPESLQAAFLLHATLLPLLCIATFIDFDEQTIPDAVTLPGTLMGLLFAATIPAASLPVVTATAPQFAGGVRHESLATLAVSSPFPWDESLDGPRGLLMGIGCLAGWCVAIAPRLWTLRRGLRKAVVYLVVNFLRSGWLAPLLAVFVLGSGLITLCWWSGGLHWHSLFSALVGMAFGGGLVWLVRIAASHALGEEAMGFGDVTLMAMIGAFLGWQPALLVFFLAPAAALGVSVAQWLITRRRDIAFGPYLCVATVGVVLRWPALWEGWGAGFFALGWLVPATLLFCLALMALMLTVWGFIKRRLFAN